MKHLFAVVREERTNLLGEVKTNKVQRGCVYNPIKGADLQDVTIKNFDFNNSTWIDNLFAVIDTMTEDNESYKIVCNKKIAIIGRMMEKAVTVVILGKVNDEDESDIELLNNAVNNGVSIDVVNDAKQSNNKLEDFSKILVLSVMGLKCSENIELDHLMTIANYVMKGFRFDNIYYIADGYDRLKDQSTKQFWININAIKTAMIDGIQSEDNKDIYKDVAPIQVVYAD